MKISLSRPEITSKDIQSVIKSLKTPYLSLGPRLVEFESKTAKYAGVKYAIAVNSGTSALHLIVRALGIKGGDEVITTPFSFIASSNSILFEGADPVFVDIDPNTLNINVDLIERRISKKTKAILAVDVFGHPAEWEALGRIVRKHGLKLIEDSCEALGSEYKGKRCGSFGDAGAFAFYPNKQITTGEGGMVVTDNSRIADLARSMRNQGRGKKSTWLNHVRLGYNYRISEINCVLGSGQIRRIDKIRAKRGKAADMYNDKLKVIEEIDLPYIAPEVKMSWFVYVIKLKKSFNRRRRDSIIKFLKSKNIGCSTYFHPIHLQPFYRKLYGFKKGMHPVTEYISERTIALPFFNNITGEEIDYIFKNLAKAIKKVKKEK